MGIITLIMVKFFTVLWKILTQEDQNKMLRIYIYLILKYVALNKMFQSLFKVIIKNFLLY